jgi:hypothetical protein
MKSHILFGARFEKDEMRGATKSQHKKRFVTSYNGLNLSSLLWHSFQIPNFQLETSDMLGPFGMSWSSGDWL